MDVGAIAHAIADVFGDSITRPLRMRLGHPDTGEVWVAGPEHAGQVWVHAAGETLPIIDAPRADDQASVTTALLPPDVLARNYVIYGTPVLCKTVSGIFQVISSDGLAAAEYLFGLNNRPQTSIDISQFDYGLLRPTLPASWRVMVTTAMYNAAGQIRSVPTLQSDSLQSYATGLLPGEARALQVLVDPVTPALELTVSDVFANSSLHDNVFSHYPVAVPADRYHAGWVKVYAGQGVIAQEDILPAPEVLSKAAGTGGGALVQQPETITFVANVFAGHQALWVDGFTVGTGGSLTIAGRVIVFSV